MCSWWGEMRCHALWTGVTDVSMQLQRFCMHASIWSRTQYGGWHAVPGTSLLFFTHWLTMLPILACTARIGKCLSHAAVEGIRAQQCTAYLHIHEAGTCRRVDPLSRLPASAWCLRCFPLFQHMHSHSAPTHVLSMSAQLPDHMPVHTINLRT